MSQTVLSRTFKAQSLLETRARREERRLEMTFVDGQGRRQTLSLPADVAVDLAGVLQSLAAGLASSGQGHLTKMPRQTAVGSARHERLVLIRFDDDPPYALPPEEAENLWRGVREEAEQVSQLKPPLRQ
jgi:hypothetical protein